MYTNFRNIYHIFKLPYKKMGTPPKFPPMLFFTKSTAWHNFDCETQISGIYPPVKPAQKRSTMEPFEISCTTKSNRAATASAVLHHASRANMPGLAGWTMSEKPYGIHYQDQQLRVLGKPLTTVEQVCSLRAVLWSGINRLFPIHHPLFHLIKQRLQKINLLLRLINHLSPQTNLPSCFMIGFLGGFDHSPPEKPNKIA